MTPERGFPASEFAARLDRAQTAMARAGLDALLLTTEPEVRYFTGYLTRFWESPTRPWFLLVPQSGRPVAVIPSIGAALMRATGRCEVRTWSAPCPGDDGISLLADTIIRIAGRTAAIGVPSGHESHLRMPLADYASLTARLPECRFRDDDGIMRRLRMVKSPAEIAKIRQACAIAGRAFARVPQIATCGTSLADVFRRFQMLCLEEGADWVPYLAGGAGPYGYVDVISPADAREIVAGDVVMLDTGLVWDGYFCDFDRNWALVSAAPEARDGYARLTEAVDAGIAAAKPGATAADVCAAMARITAGDDGPSDAGRSGHGLGMQLTEWPSLIPDDTTVLEAGMVLTLEPCVATKGDAILVHEENIVITAQGAEYLSPVAAASLPVLKG